MANREEGKRAQASQEPGWPRWLGKFVVGGIAVGFSLSGVAAGYAEDRAQDSNSKALHIMYKESSGGRNDSNASQEFRDQNQHTKDLGELTHYLRLAGVGVLVVTVAFGTGVITGMGQRPENPAPGVHSSVLYDVEAEISPATTPQIEA